MLGQFLVEEPELEPEPELELELAFEPELDGPDDPEFPELLDDGVVAGEPGDVPLELVPLLPVPGFDPDEPVVAAFATTAPPPTSPTVRAPTATALRRRIFISLLGPFLSCHDPPPRAGLTQRAPWICEHSYNRLGRLVEFPFDLVTILRKRRWERLRPGRWVWAGVGERPWPESGSAVAR
jgi:hypothetical protein